MYAVSGLARVYISFFLFLCLALFSTATLANDGYWSTYERRFVPQSEVNRNVQRILDSSVKKPTGSTLGASPTAPTISKNPAGGLSATTQNTIKTMGQPSSFNSTLNNSVSSAKTALKGCVRSPACAGRALGGGAIIYEGIQAWKEVYDYVYADGQVSESLVVELTDTYPNDSGYLLYGRNPNVPIIYPTVVSACQAIAASVGQTFTGLRSTNNLCCETVTSSGSRDGWCTNYTNSTECAPDTIKISGICVSNKRQTVPVSHSELDQSIDDSYSPEVSDAPIVLLSGEPESINLSTPAPAELPSTTTTSTDSSGQTTTSVTNETINYNVTNNNTSSPSINSSTTSTITKYDSNSNVVDTSTSTTTESGVQPDVSPSAPPIEFELPAFCSWATIVCDWIGWTKEGVEGEEPDLSVLISEFEPDENEYTSSIGAGSCPAPMSLNLGIINRTVEVSYQPFCDFLDMIRPLVIAGAWLLSAFMYVGVLRRG